MIAVSYDVIKSKSMKFTRIASSTELTKIREIVIIVIRSKKISPLYSGVLPVTGSVSCG